MAKPEWGAKRVCHSCGAAFYDLKRDPIVCPKCATEYDPEAILKSRRSRAPVAEEKAATKAAAVLSEAEVELEVEVEDTDEVAAEDDELMEDTSELGEDDEDMAEVIENLDNEGEDR
ncbi:TIGR02300 family protein [Lacibacterium aquatile]|uniref:TIGR02300 family protein n=1 Tax=Lacibacterium aquatile TaxID=1168082 RepID=A0ABW5DMN3_9PROT